VGGEPTIWLPTDLGAKLANWLRSDLGVTKDAQDRISNGADQSVNGEDVCQATDAAKPVWWANQLDGCPSWRFDGIDDCIYNDTFNLNQPADFYIVFKIITWVLNSGIFDGGGPPDVNQMRFSMNDVSPELKMFSGAFSPAITTMQVGEYKLVQCNFNGASSKARVNGANLITGDCGPNNIVGGTKIAGLRTYQYLSNIDFIERIVCNETLSDTDRLLLENYIKTRYPSLGM
jgi:hypothetical protein